MSYFSQSAKKCSIQPNLVAPSPFKYNPAKITKPAHARTPFGSTTKLDRSTTSQNNKTQFAGNGPYIQPCSLYQNTLNELSNMVNKQDKNSSAFVSKTHRFQTKKQQTPGPGQYDHLLKLRRSHSNNRLQKSSRNINIMSTSQLKVPSIPSDHLGYKEDQNNVMKKVVLNRNLQPHPGSYDIRTDPTQSKVLKWKKQSNKQKSISLTPGPGAYSFKADSQLKAPASSFVSQSQRFMQHNQKKALKPGPGSYNPFPTKKKSHSSNQDGNFNSKTTRFSFVSEINKIGPGQYFNSVKQRVKTKSMTALKKHMHQQEPQIIVHKKTIFDEKNTNPGPGQYANTLGITFKLQKQLFRKFNDTTLPKQKRTVFQLSQNAITPGPGAYNELKIVSQSKQKALVPPGKKQSKKTQVVNLKDYQEEMTPSPFDYGNYTNTIENKIKQFQNKVTLTQSKPFGTGQHRFRHYETPRERYLQQSVNQQVQDLEETKQSGQQLGYYQNTKRVKKLVMTNIKIKVPFGSSSLKMKQTILSESPAKFYNNDHQWVKKSHNIRSKLD